MEITPSTAPPSKKKHTKETEPKNALEQRQDKIDEDMKIVRNLIVELQHESAKQGQQLDWICIELKKAKNDKGQ